MADESEKECCRRTRERWMERIRAHFTSYPAIKDVPCDQGLEIIEIRVYGSPVGCRSRATPARARSATRRVSPEGPPVTASPPPAPPTLLPDDDANRALMKNVHPQGWTNPTPAGRYNLVVVGAGTAGLVTAAGAAGLGARVALIERRLMGGDCLNFGCVPSKAILRVAHVAALVREAGGYGVAVDGPPRVDFGAVMARMRRLRAVLSPTDSAARFRGLGVDVYFGDARFVSPDTVAVDG